MGRKQRYRHLARQIYPYSPWLAIKLADLRGRVLEERAGRSSSPVIPTREELEALFGEGNLPDYEQVARGCARSQARSRLIKEIGFAQGPVPLRPLVDVTGGEHLKRLKEAGGGVLLATWHSGPTPAAWSCILDYDVSLATIQAIDTTYVHPGWKIFLRGLSSIDGLRILKLASRHLREGGWVGAAIDVNQGVERTVELPFFGRAVPYPPGLPALALLADVPVVGIVARWEQDAPRIKVEISEPIYWRELAPEGGAAAERAILERLVGQMEAFFRAYPTELSRSKVKVLLDFPRIQ